MSIPTHTDVFILRHIGAIAYAGRGLRRNNRPRSELGLKRGFMKDLRLGVALVALEAVLTQLAPPNLGLADVAGHYARLVYHITGRIRADSARRRGSPRSAGSFSCC